MLHALYKKKQKKVSGAVVCCEKGIEPERKRIIMMV